jgi:predicted nucleic acid-binding protein
VPITLDASIVGCWFFEDEQDARAEAAWTRLDTDRAIVPLQWWFEVRNVCLIGERRRRAIEAYTDEFLAELLHLAIDLDALPDQRAVMSLARRHKLTVYDAAYLELAQRNSLELATLDNRLAAAALAEGVPLITG